MSGRCLILIWKEWMAFCSSVVWMWALTMLRFADEMSDDSFASIPFLSSVMTSIEATVGIGPSVTVTGSTIFDLSGVVELCLGAGLRW